MLREQRLVFLASTLLVAHAAAAGEQNPSTDEGLRGEPPSYIFGLGLGGIARQQAYAGIDRDILPIPIVYFENRWLQLIGPAVEFKLPGLAWGGEQELSFGLRAEFDGSGYKAKDAPVLQGMARRKNGVLAGISAKWSNPLVELKGEWMMDASSASEGQRIRVGVERAFQAGERFTLTPGASATYLDGKYADYYYGVRAGEARAGRPAHVVDATVNAGFALRTDYMIDRKQMLFLQAEYTALGNEITDSPLVSRSGETSLFLGYLYRF
jgi:outer membrane protein